MPKVYETSSGRKTRSFTLYPSWRCPRCKAMRREPIGRVCRSCKEKDEPKGDPMEGSIMGKIIAGHSWEDD